MRTREGDEEQSSRRSRWAALALIGACAWSGCAHAPKVEQPVRVADTVPRILIAHLGELPEAQRPASLAALPRPVVIAIRRFDHFPLEFVLESSLMTLVRRGEWELKALDDFFILLRDQEPPLVSRDGVLFSAPLHKAFEAGVDVDQSGSPELRVGLGFDAPPSPTSKK